VAARRNGRTAANPAPIDFRLDFNRDRRVDADDQLIAMARTGSCQRRTADDWVSQ
jgi:hypothetical protein